MLWSYSDCEKASESDFKDVILITLFERGVRTFWMILLLKYCSVSVANKGNAVFPVCYYMSNQTLVKYGNCLFLQPL